MPGLSKTIELDFGVQLRGVDRDSRLPPCPGPREFWVEKVIIPPVLPGLAIRPFHELGNPPLHHLKIPGPGIKGGISPPTPEDGQDFPVVSLQGRSRHLLLGSEQVV